jgi:hypothetical protein
MEQFAKIYLDTDLSFEDVLRAVQQLTGGTRSVRAGALPRRTSRSSCRVPAPRLGSRGRILVGTSCDDGAAPQWEGVWSVGAPATQRG